MIVGLGIDIIEIARLDEVLSRHGDKFLERTYTEKERASAARKKAAVNAFYAGRWAAKEALAKALGCGFSKDCGWLDIEVINNDAGQPLMSLSGKAAAHAEKIGVSEISLSISHEKSYACAVVILEGRASA